MYRRALLLKRRILSFPVHQCSILTQYTFQRFSELVCGLFLREMRRYLLLINPHAYSIPSPANSKCYLGVDIIFTPLFSQMNSMMDVSKIFTILQQLLQTCFFNSTSNPSRTDWVLLVFAESNFLLFMMFTFSSVLASLKKLRDDEFECAICLEPCTKR